MRVIIHVLASVMIGILLLVAEGKSHNNENIKEQNTCYYPEDCTLCTGEIENVSPI